MSYGLYKYITAKELAGDTSGNTFQIELWKKNYSGSSEELEGADSYFEHEYTTIDSRNPFDKPVNDSALSMFFHVQNSSHLTLLTEIQDADEDEFILKKKVDGSYDWQGKVVNDLLEYEEGDYPFTGKITAKDLTYLKGQEYALTTGYEKIIITLADVLGDLGFGIGFKTHTNWVENNQSDTSDDFLNQVYHDKFAFRKYATSTTVDDQTITKYEVLERICRNHQLILRQVSGQWYVYQLSELSDPTSLNVFSYDSSGSQTGTTTQDITTSIDNSDLYSLPSGINKTNPAVKKATVVFDHRTGTTEQFVNVSFLSSTTDPAIPNARFSMNFNGSGDEYVIVQGGTYAVCSRNYQFNNDEFPQSAYLLKSSQYYWIEEAQEWQEVANITTTRESVAPGNIDTGNNKIRLVSTDFRHGDVVRFEAGFATGIDADTEYYLIDVSGEVETGSNTLYYQISTEPDGTPVVFSTPSASNKYAYRVSNRQQMTNRTVPFGGVTWWCDFNFTTSNIPSDSDDDVQFYAMGSVMPPITTDGSNNQYWEYVDNVNQWRDLSVSVRDVTTSNGDSITYELEQSGNFSTELFYDSVYFGDGPLDYSRSALAVTTTTTADTPTSQWDFRGGSTNSNFFEIWLKEVLNFQRGSRRNLSAELYGLYNGYEVLSYESKYFFFLGGTHTGKGNTWSGDWVEINIATGTDTFTSYVDATNSVGSGGGTGGGSPSTSEGTYLEVANNLDDVESASTSRINLGLEIGVDVQAWDAQLDDIAGLTPSDGNFIVGNGTNFVAESGNTARTSLGLGTSDDVQFDDLTLTGVLRTNEIDTQSDLVWNTSTEVWNTSDYYISGALNIAGSVYITDDLNVAESLTVGTTLDVTGNTTISGTLDAPTLNTGQGDNELYAMNQNVRTSDSVTFDSLAVTNNATIGGSLTLTGSADFNSTMNLQGNLTTQANLADDGFVEGWAGTNWKINADGSAEFEEMRIRGALRVYEFIAKQISTIGGSEILSIAQGRVSSVNVGTDTITVENVTGTPGNAFKANDLWICQVVDINNDLESGGTGSIVKSVRGTVTSVSGNDIVVTIDAGDITQLEQGDLIIAYGNTSDADRQAIMYRNVDRSEDNLIMRLQTEVNSFADLQAVTNTRVAFGDLNGYSGLSTETFGFFAGDNSNEHILITDGGLFLKDGASTLAQLTSNTFKVGDSTNFLSFDGTTFDIQTDTFNLDTTNLDISSANENIVIGTSSYLVTLGRLNTNEQGLTISTPTVTNQNFWKLSTGDIRFKVGDGTNYLEYNETAGSFEIKVPTFTLDATDASGGIKVESANQRIQLEDADRVRTQVDVNDGTFSLTETSEYNAGDATVINQGTAYISSAFETTKGDSLYIDVGAELTSLGADGSEAYIQVEALGSTSSGGSYTSFGSFLSSLATSVGNTVSVKFSAHSYSYDWVKIRITVFSNDTGFASQFELNQNIIVKSYDSQTRLSLDGLFVNNNTKQYARLTRSENELSGIIKMKNLPTADPQVAGVIYNDGGTLKISAG